MAARGTKRPQNACRKCGHTWYPRGNNRSLKCPSCGNGDVKIVGPGVLGAVLLVGFLILSGGNKESSSGAAATADRSPSSSVVQRPTGADTTYSSRDPMPRGTQGFDSSPGAQAFPAIPVPLAPEPGNSGSRVKPPALNVARAPNGAAWPIAAGYVDGYESRDYGGSVVNLVNKKNGNAFFVKLVSSAQGVGAASRHVYVGAQQQFSIVNIGTGEYYLAFQDLVSKKYFRTKSFSLSQGPDPSDASRLKYTTMGFEFSVRGAEYLDARQISAAEFGGGAK